MTEKKSSKETKGSREGKRKETVEAEGDKEESERGYETCTGQGLRRKKCENGRVVRQRAKKVLKNKGKMQDRKRMEKKDRDSKNVQKYKVSGSKKKKSN